MKDLLNKEFGLLTVIEYLGKNEKKENIWLCECKCGNTTVTTSSCLLTGNKNSCGCLKRKPKTHGKRYTKLYYIWSNMKNRCFNKKCKDYIFYGARGISVCNDWRSFEFFDEWAIENGYREGLSLDRIDNDRSYCPENCRWVTMNEQFNNRRSNHYIEYNGENKTITQWAKEYGMTEQMLSGRLRKGWSMEDALTRSKKEPKTIEYNGVTYTISEFSKKHGLPYYIVNSRLRSNWDIDRIINTPYKKGEIQDDNS